jgi:hypothetical protein
LLEVEVHLEILEVVAELEVIVLLVMALLLYKDQRYHFQI